MKYKGFLLKMKNLLNELNFTKKSLIPVGLICVVAIYGIMSTLGFSDKCKAILSWVFSGIVLLGYLLYLIIVLFLYYLLPKNKSNNIGVLFVIDSKNHSDYLAVKDKLIANFRQIAANSKVNVLNPIVLSEKVISTRRFNKIFWDESSRGKLLIKCRCHFIIYIKTTDTGRNSDTYELSISATILHTKFDAPIKDIFEKNLANIFKPLQYEILNRNDELQNLKVKSNKLYVVCQLLYATACEYSGRFFWALPIFKELRDQLMPVKDEGFYKIVNNIVELEIFSCFVLISNIEYLNYIESGKYIVENVKKANSYLHSIVNKLNANYQVDYHNNLSIMFVLNNNINEAKRELELLPSNCKQLPLKKRWWEYSKVFILACENNPSYYNKIISTYKRIKNVTVHEYNVLHFIKMYLNTHGNLTGLKLALFSFCYYHPQIGRDELSDDFTKNLICELNNKGCSRTVEIINSMMAKLN